MEELIEERRGRVLLATFNRPDRLNAFTGEQYARLGALLSRAREDDEISVVLVTGTGRAFSSGDDLSLYEDPALAEEAKPVEEAWMATTPQRRRNFKTQMRLML